MGVRQLLILLSAEASWWVSGNFSWWVSGTSGPCWWVSGTSLLVGVRHLWAAARSRYGQHPLSLDSVACSDVPLSQRPDPGQARVRRCGG
jgi:hypothetical protein